MVIRTLKTCGHIRTCRMKVVLLHLTDILECCNVFEVHHISLDCHSRDEPYKTVRADGMPMVQGAPSVFTTLDGTLPSGIITKPATRFAGSTLGTNTMFVNGDGASIAGFPSNQQYLIYDESADDTPIVRKCR